MESIRRMEETVQREITQKLQALQDLPPQAPQMQYPPPQNILYTQDDGRRRAPKRHHMCINW